MNTSTYAALMVVIIFLTYLLQVPQLYEVQY